jgi:pSer/pThr/pTyr-binding forkhead associated (FHA) protein
MAKLILKFGGNVLREIPVGASPVGIGRLPDNAVVIDNPAVSGHHARVFEEGAEFFIEDLNSTNGTFVNDRPVARQPLKSGDVIGIGKHALEFQAAGTVEAPAPAAGAPVIPDIGGTMMLETKHQKELLAKMKAEAEAKKAAKAPAAPAAAPVAHAPAPAVPKGEAPPAAPAPSGPAAAGEGAAPAPKGKFATLTVVSGATDKPEYTLEAMSVIIGKADNAQVKLKGWFKPDMAAAINRKGEGYVLTVIGGKATVNKQPVTSRQELADGDLIEVSGVTLHFKIKG